MGKKKEVKPKRSVKPHELYDIKGDSVERKRKSCPKCGPGTFLAKHKGREYCGKCHYMETVSSKKPEAPKEEAKPEVSKKAEPKSKSPKEEAKPEEKKEEPKKE